MDARHRKKLVTFSLRASKVLARNKVSLKKLMYLVRVSRSNYLWTTWEDLEQGGEMGELFEFSRKTRACKAGQRKFPRHSNYALFAAAAATTQSFYFYSLLFSPLLYILQNSTLLCCCYYLARCRISPTETEGKGDVVVPIGCCPQSRRTFGRLAKNELVPQENVATFIWARNSFLFGNPDLDHRTYGGCRFYFW